MCAAGSEFLPRGPERPLHEAVEVKHGMCWRPQILEMSESGDTCRGKLLTGSTPGIQSLSCKGNLMMVEMSGP